MDHSLWFTNISSVLTLRHAYLGISFRSVSDPRKDPGENPIISAQEDDFAASTYSGDESYEFVVVI